MKVGDYVRTKRGQIYKITDLKGYYENDKLIEDRQYVYIDNHFSGWDLGQFKELIIKSNPNIIVLFEEHDLVVIEYYSLRYDERVTRLFEVTYKDNKNIILDNAKCSFMLINNDFNDEDKKLEPIIKSIVTKEQFSQMEYKVGD